MSTTSFAVEVHPGDRSAYPRPSFARIVRLELRKILDVRSGPALLVVTLLLVLLVLGVMVLDSGGPQPGVEGVPADNDVRFGDVLGPANSVAVQLVPLLGLLAMTSEWTQRTALTTFTLVPRRARVLLAKLTAAVALAAAVSLVVAALAAVATAVRGARLGVPVHWGLEPVGGSVVALVLAALMGAALGALIMITAPAVVAYFVAPTIVLIVVSLATQGREGPTDWVNVQEAFGRLSSFDLAGKGAQTFVAVVLWVVLPLLGGLWRSLRRDAS